MAVFFIAVWQLETLATLFLLSFLLAYVLNPLVSRLDRLRFVNRTAATLITLFGMLVGFLAVFFIIVPEVVEEFRQFLSRLPGYLIRLQATVVPWVEQQLDVEVPISVEGALTQFRREINEIAPKIIGPVTQVAAQVFGGTFSAVAAGVAVMMFPLFLFFLLKDYPRIVNAIKDLVPLETYEGVQQITQEINQSLSAFLHGQFTVMLVLATLYSVGYSIVGIPVAVGVGLLTGMLCFIPYVGAATGFLVALLLSLLAFSGFGTVLGVVIVFGTVQLLDATVITPKILGGKLGLTPLWIIVALMAGAELFGFLGVLLAVPSIAVLKVLMHHALIQYKNSPVYRGEADGEPGAVPGDATSDEGSVPAGTD